jgi:hypothetical protein
MRLFIGFFLKVSGAVHNLLYGLSDLLSIPHAVEVATLVHSEHMKRKRF